VPKRDEKEKVGFSQMVRQNIGPVEAFKTAVVVPEPAQDALREDSAWHDAEDCGWRPL
jgi:hypothetical protein